MNRPPAPAMEHPVADGLLQVFHDRRAYKEAVDAQLYGVIGVSFNPDGKARRGDPQP